MNTESRGARAGSVWLVCAPTSSSCFQTLVTVHSSPALSPGMSENLIVTLAGEWASWLATKTAAALPGSGLYQACHDGTVRRCLAPLPWLSHVVFCTQVARSAMLRLDCINTVPGWPTQAWLTASAWMFVIMCHTLSTALSLEKSIDNVIGAESTHQSPKCVRCSVMVGCTKPPSQGPYRPVVDSSGVCPCTPTICMSGYAQHPGPCRPVVAYSATSCALPIHESYELTISWPVRNWW
mmetsp:Transcript_49328/g.81909  ORF Transcript_49328/g.81909 Transcript_49328/m.81909 type:complete len:238 (-) Transcript_49328:934-1647(-)